VPHVVYAERPDVEVCIDSAWWPGELRTWTQRGDGSWWAQVSWRTEPGMAFLATVPEHVRPA
jgi:hypothetical protein